MRPLSLTLEGFTCFKNRQGPIDLACLGLFAISGPTGAGKSSLLDAIIFALYGKVPRMGGKGLSELISLGSDRMVVALDFSVGQEKYRIVRRSRRRGATDVQLERFQDTTAQPVAEGVRQVEEHITQLVGLRYEAFTQAVVLPQGEFQRFLKSQPRERREILRDLLRLQVYERMREMARRTQDELSTRVDNLQERLSEEYAGVTAPALQARKSELQLLIDANKAAAETSRKCEANLAIVRLQFEKSQELLAKREDLQRLCTSEAEVQVLITRLAAARRANTLVPLAEGADAAKQAAITGAEQSHRSTRIS